MEEIKFFLLHTYFNKHNLHTLLPRASMSEATNRWWPRDRWIVWMGWGTGRQVHVICWGYEFTTAETSISRFPKHETQDSFHFRSGERKWGRLWISGISIPCFMLSISYITKNMC